MIFQEPMTSLNPVFTVGDQISEAIALHQSKRAGEARAEALRLLDLVRIPEARRVFARHPHQLSGGMRQRVMIAMALSCRPALLIADEPTTALDVTVQAQIIELLRELNRERGTSIVLITHDMGVVAGLADDVMVMYAGRTVEYASADAIFCAPSHPYTIGLLNALPRLDAPDDAPLVAIPGNPPLPGQGLSGCAFAKRCSHASDRCGAERPDLIRYSDAGALRACHRPIAEITGGLR